MALRHWHLCHQQGRLGNMSCNTFASAGTHNFAAHNEHTQVLTLPAGRQPTCEAADCAVLKAFESAPVSCPDRLAILLCHDCPSSCSPFLAWVQSQSHCMHALQLPCSQPCRGAGDS